MQHAHEQVTLVKLKIIASLSIGDKLNTRFLLIQKDCLSTKVSRSFYGENRSHTITFCRNTIEQAISLFRQNQNMDPTQKNNIKQDLTQAILGLSNLKETYGDDVRVICELNEIIETIKRTC